MVISPLVSKNELIKHKPVPQTSKAEKKEFLFPIEKPTKTRNEREGLNMKNKSIKNTHGPVTSQFDKLQPKMLPVPNDSIVDPSSIITNSTVTEKEPVITIDLTKPMTKPKSQQRGLRSDSEDMQNINKIYEKVRNVH